MNERFTAWRRRWWHLGVLFLIGAWTMVILAVVALGGALFDEVLFAGPDFVVATPDSDPGTMGVTTFTPTSLDSDALRIGWAIGSSLIVLGIGLGLLSIAQVAVSEGSRPIFGKRAGSFFSYRLTFALLLVAFGGLTRFALEGRIADQLGIQRLAAGDDFDLWIFDVPVLTVVIGAQLVGAIWNRASSLQSEVEEIV